MSHYTPQELLSKWANDEITVEQAVGQLILIAKKLQKELDDLKKQSATGQTTKSNDVNL